MRIRRVLLVVGACAALLLLGGCSATSTSSDTEHIDSFAADYTIEQSGVVHVVETIHYDFANVPDKHGILRFLDSRFVNTATTDRVYQYTNLKVSSPSGAPALFSTALQDGLEIQIRNVYATVSGKQVYLVSYDVHGALNQTRQADGTGLDEFFWNVTGTESQVPTDRTSVTVHGPVDVTNLSCVAGSPGSTTACPMAAGIGGRAARFATGRLGPGQGVTVDVGWPTGTFASTAAIIEPHLSPDAGNIYSGSNYGPDPFWTPWNWGGGILMLLGIPLGFCGYLLLRRRDEEFAGETPGTIPTDIAAAPLRSAPARETIVVQYEPPAGYPVGAVNLLRTRRQKKDDITVTLIDLAARGHLTITEVTGGERRKARDYTLTATPDRVGSADAALLPHETLLLDRLFPRGRTKVSLSTLKYNFSSDVDAVKAALSAWMGNGGYFRDKLGAAHPVLRWTIVASIVAFGALLFLTKGWVLIPLGAIAGSIVAYRLAPRAVRRRAKGHAVLIDIEGFRLYIATAEVDQIRFEENEDVFSRYLPWAIVFGETERWVRVFSELANEGKLATSPAWYIGDLHAVTRGSLGGSLAAISSIGAAVSGFSAITSESMTAAAPATVGSSGGSGFGGVIGEIAGGAIDDVGGGGGGGGTGSW